MMTNKIIDTTFRSYGWAARQYNDSSNKFHKIITCMGGRLVTISIDCQDWCNSRCCRRWWETNVELYQTWLRLMIPKMPIAKRRHTLSIGSCQLLNIGKWGCRRHWWHMMMTGNRFCKDKQRQLVYFVIGKLFLCVNDIKLSHSTFTTFKSNEWESLMNSHKVQSWKLSFGLTFALPISVNAI